MLCLHFKSGSGFRERLGEWVGCSDTYAPAHTASHHHDFHKSQDYTQPALRHIQPFALGRLMKCMCAYTCAHGHTHYGPCHCGYTC